MRPKNSLRNKGLHSACAFSVVSDSATLWTAAHQAPLSMDFSRQEYRSELPFPPPGDLPNPWNQTLISYVSCIGM